MIINIGFTRRVLIMLIFVFVVFYVGTMAVTEFASYADSKNVILPGKVPVENLSSKVWLSKWWIWFTSIPDDIHPVEKYPDVKRCSSMQNGPVYFLPNYQPPITHNYECEIPHGYKILLPLTTTECENGGVEGKMDDRELKDCAFNIMTPLQNIQVTLDGMQVKVDGLGPPIETDYFNVTYPKNPLKIWGPINPGTYRSIASGYYLFLNDLSLGKHYIHLKIVDLLKGRESYELPSEANYDLTDKIRITNTEYDF